MDPFSALLFRSFLCFSSFSMRMAGDHPDIIIIISAIQSPSDFSQADGLCFLHECNDRINCFGRKHIVDIDLSE